MNPQKLTFAVSVAVATTALLTATAALTFRAKCGPSAAPVADVAIATPAPPAVEPQEGEEALKKIREAARDYIRAAYPGSKPDGVFALPFTRDGDLAWAGVDTKTAQGERTTIDLIVRRYVRKNGAVYYRAEGFGRGGRDALLNAMQQGRSDVPAGL